MSSTRPDRSAPRASSPPVWSATLPSWAMAPEEPRRRRNGLLAPWRAARKLRRRRAAPVPTRWTCARCGAEAHSGEAAALHVQSCRAAAS
jgi:hypothetical protein